MMVPNSWGITRLEDVMKVFDLAGQLHWVVSLPDTVDPLDDWGEGLLRTTWGHTCFDAKDLFQYPGYSTKCHIELPHSCVAVLFPVPLCEEYFYGREDIQESSLPDRLYMQLPTRPHPGEQAPAEYEIPLPAGYEELPLPLPVASEQIPLPAGYEMDLGDSQAWAQP